MRDAPAMLGIMTPETSRAKIPLLMYSSGHETQKHARTALQNSG